MGWMEELLQDQNNSFSITPGLAFINTSIYPDFNLHVAEEIRRIDHIIEDEEGVIGVLEDGSKVRLDGYIGTITMRIRYFLELIAGTDEITEEIIVKLHELKDILAFEEEEVVLARKRLNWAEQVIGARAF